MNSRIALSILSVAILVGSAAAGIRSAWHPEAHADEPRTHVMTEAERMALAGLQGDVARLGFFTREDGQGGFVIDVSPLGDIGRITTSQAAMRQIGQVALMCREIGRAESRLAIEAARTRHLDVALVQSGTSWIEAKR